MAAVVRLCVLPAGAVGLVGKLNGVAVKLT